MSVRQPPRMFLLLIPILILAAAVRPGISASSQVNIRGSIHGSVSGSIVTWRRKRAGKIAEIVKHMSLRERVGQMLMVSFTGTTLSQSTLRMLRRIRPGGITLFADNFSSTAQIKSLDSSLQHHSRLPLLISVDQEGGEVRRITSGVKQLPSEAFYGRLNKHWRVYHDTSIAGGQLRGLGINMNLAPVLDVATNPNSIMAQEQRSFGPDGHRDAILSRAAIRGYQSQGIAATAKHILGLGTTSTDPETVLPHISLTTGQLRQQLLPFKKAIGAHVDAIMVTHVVLAGVTSPSTPASLSRKVVTGMLRRRMKYQGLLMTDSLTMGAVTGHFTIGQACGMSIQAGENMLLIVSGGPLGSNTLKDAVNAITRRVHARKISASSINKSVTRILKLKRRLGLPLPSSQAQPLSTWVQDGDVFLGLTANDEKSNRNVVE